jgi:transcriptional regulator with XRE-family HTH domain
MKNNVHGIKGEYRELTPKEIGDFVRRYRTLYGTKRLSLADQAGVSEKSLERLESSNKVSEEVYRKVAVAIGQPAEAFLGPRYIPTRAEAVEKAILSFQKWNEEYLTTEMRPFSDERDMRRVLETEALIFDDGPLKTDALDAAAHFKQNLSDWKDIFSGVDEPDKLQAARSLTEELRSIERLGYVARYGSCVSEFEVSRKWFKMLTAFITFFERRDWHKVSLKTMAVPRRFGAGEWGL